MWSNNSKGKELAEEAERKFAARFEPDAQDGDEQETEAQIAAQIKQWQDEADAPPPVRKGGGW